LGAAICFRDAARCDTPQIDCKGRRIPLHGVIRQISEAIVAAKDYIVANRRRVPEGAQAASVFDAFGAYTVHTI
jgi:hypothetical protein